MSAITVGGDLVHYEVLGRGRPVLLVHGWIGSWRYWVPIMRQLQLRYRVYAIDLFGFGDSGKNPAKYTVAEQVVMLDDFMKQLGIPKTAVIAHGFGAQVFVEFARKYPDRVARMLIVSAPLFDTGDLDNRVPPGHRVLLTPGRKLDPDATIPSTQRETVVNPKMIDRDRLRQAAMERGLVALQENDETGKSLPRENPLRSRLNGSMDELLARCFRRSEGDFEKLQLDVGKSDNAVIQRSVEQFDPGKVLDTLRILPMPVVVVHGENDPLIPVPVEAVWNYLTLEKDDTLLPVPLPGVRHFPMLEHEPFLRLTTSFLETPDISKIEVKTRWRRRSR